MKSRLPHCASIMSWAINYWETSQTSWDFLKAFKNTETKPTKAWNTGGGALTFSHKPIKTANILEKSISSSSFKKIIHFFPRILWLSFTSIYRFNKGQWTFTGQLLVKPPKGLVSLVKTGCKWKRLRKVEC